MAGGGGRTSAGRGGRKKGNQNKRHIRGPFTSVPEKKLRKNARDVRKDGDQIERYRKQKANR